MRFLAGLPLLLGVLAPASAPASGPPSGAPRSDLVSSLEVLHGWDDRRAAAWAEGDVAALRSLYAPGSRAGRADVRLLRAYVARGVVVRRLVTQVFAVEVVHRDATSVRLRVFDRVAGGEVVRHGRVEPLGSSVPVRRTIQLRREWGSWQVVSVSDSARGPRAARH